MIGELVALVAPLGLDTFAAAAALGATGAPARRATLLLAAAEAGMPLVGLALGAPLGRAIGGAAEWAAIGVLLALGVYGLVERDEPGLAGTAPLLLALSVSVDELALGFTLGLLGLPVVPVLVAIAAQALVLSQLGLALGARLSRRSREGAERLAAVALLAVALVLLAGKLA
jgi:manganese efflux pump family protein